MSTIAISTAAASAPAAMTATEIGFMAGITAFLGSWAVLILAVLFIFGALAEHNDASGWAIFWMLLTAVVSFFVFDVSIVMLSIFAVGYIVVGLFWSFYRYKRHADKMVQRYANSSNTEKDRALQSLHPKEMLSAITSWVIVWPFSMSANLLGDLISFVQTLVTKFFRGIYYKIYNSAAESLLKK